jgi:hypothetical protein
VSRQSWVETLIAAEIVGPTISVIGASSCLPPAARVAIPSNFFDIGMSLRILASGVISSPALPAPAGTAQFLVTLGGNTVFDSLAIPLVLGATNRNWNLDILLTCRAIGPAAILIGQGTWLTADIVAAPLATQGQYIALLPWNSPPTTGGTFDSTFAAQLDLVYVRTATNGGMTLEQYSVQAIN